MTLPVGGGVPEPRAEWNHILERVHYFPADDEVRVFVEKLLAALERPRPALPEPSVTLRFHTFPCPECHAELGQILRGVYTFTKPHPLCLADSEYAKLSRDVEEGRAGEQVGAPQTGNPPPDAIEHLTAEIYEDANGQGWHSATSAEQEEYRAKVKRWLRGGRESPEQGLREALERIANYEYYINDAAGVPVMMKKIARAALERPRPALPKSTLCFHSFPCPSCGEEMGQVLRAVSGEPSR